MRQIRQIIIHCSATKPSQDVGAADIRRWHLDQGWSDIGYHHVIRRDGRIEQGRLHEHPGAHTQGHNLYSLGVCLVGGINSSGKPDSNFTRHQWRSLDALVTQLTQQYPGATVTGHRSFTTKKDCPSFDAVEWWAK